VHAYLSFTEDFPAVKDFFGFITVPRGERCELPGVTSDEGHGGAAEQPHPSTPLSAATAAGPDPVRPPGGLTAMQAQAPPSPSPDGRP